MGRENGFLSMSSLPLPQAFTRSPDTNSMNAPLGLATNRLSADPQILDCRHRGEEILKLR